MKRFNWIVISLIALIVVTFGAGCNSMTDTSVVTTTKPDGTKIVEQRNVVEKSSVRKDKITVLSSTMTGLIVQPSGSSSGGTPLADVTIRTGSNTTVSSPANVKRIVHATAKGAGLLNSLTNSSATSDTEVFLGAEGDPGQGAAAFFNALANLQRAKNGAISSASTTTNADGSSTASTTTGSSTASSTLNSSTTNSDSSTTKTEATTSAGSAESTSGSSTASTESTEAK